MADTNYKYFNRDISWLHFNHRVLEEASDKSIPLMERIKFLAIYSNNLEEFYSVRVSYYRNLIRELPEDHPKRLEVKPDAVIKQINDLVISYQGQFSKIFHNDIIPELEDNRIFLVRDDNELPVTQEANLKRIFNSSILPVLQPVLLQKHRIRPFLKTGQLYVIAEFYRKGIPKLLQNTQYGLVKIPTDHNIPRFIQLPVENDAHYVVFLENVVMRYIDTIFPGYEVKQWYNVKMTRDADLDYDDYVGHDLIKVISHIESSREIGPPNRFQYDRRMPEKLLEFLKIAFHLHDQDMVKGGSIHNFRDFFAFPNPLTPRLEFAPMVPLRIAEIDASDTTLNEVFRNDYLLHFPYQSYHYFIRFLQNAANSPLVTEIKATQYRVASNSAVVDALILAAENGKKVTVFVELKARFDEEANLKYANEMKKAGIKIIYSIAGLKVHAKVAMVYKTDEDGNQKCAGFLGTGNFNEKTARLYVDHGLFTADERIIEDLKSLFAYLEDQHTTPVFNHILVPKFNMVATYMRLIDREIKNVKDGLDGYMCIKMNGLEDPVMIDKLYEASSAGVKIDIIIRGICRLVPDQPYSKNIRLIRIIDRFLEHARVFMFHNNGEEEVYLGSADWMRRNLNRRVECVFPLFNSRHRKEIIDLLKIQLADNVKASYITEDMTNLRVPKKGKIVRSQVAIYDYLKTKKRKKKDLK